MIDHAQKNVSNQDIAMLIQQEIAKYFSGQTQTGNSSNKPTLDFAHFVNSTGNTECLKLHCACSMIEGIKQGSWILNTGTSRHMCTDKNLLTPLLPVSTPILVLLPDCSVKTITHIGQVSLTKDIMLKDVLNILSFRYKLLSIPQLTSCSNMKCIFTHTHCLIQDLQTEKLIAIGRLVGKLYVLELSSGFLNTDLHVNHLANLSFFPCNMSLDLWHQTLGHASLSILQHISFLKPQCTEAVMNKIKF